MNAQQKAAKGLRLIQESILDFLKQHKKEHKRGISNAHICRELGLQQDPSKFTTTLSWAILELLVLRGHARSRGKRSKKVYFFAKKLAAP